MTLDRQEISRLLAEAENKILKFEQKIQNITAALVPLQIQREAVLAAIEFADREKARRKLTDLFVTDGEYGLPINFSADLLRQIEQRKNELDRRIQSYEQKREERQKGIEFIRHDIELLKKAQYLDVKASIYEAAALIDS